IIFNYDGYGPDWEPEAARRGLLNNKNTADAVPVFFEKKNIDIFVRQGVYTAEEAVARAEIMLENYVKTINIEALTTAEMAKQDIFPAVSDYVATLCANVAAKQGICAELPCESEKAVIKTLSTKNDEMMSAVKVLEAALKDMPKDVREASQKMAHVVIPAMNAVRAAADEMEALCAKEYWPYPSYTDLMYSVK
ncbi:MAG: glutamine synthetase type III, partial [Christensenellaceae bacterium]